MMRCVDNFTEMPQSMPSNYFMVTGFDIIVIC